MCSKFLTQKLSIFFWGMSVCVCGSIKMGWVVGTLPIKKERDTSSD